MKKKIFTKSTRILLVTLLVIVAFFKRETSQILMTVSIVIWLVITGGTLLWNPICRLLASPKRNPRKAPEKRKPQRQAPDSETVRNQEPAFQEKQDKRYQKMLQHVSLRITEKLKSAYPQCTWTWEKEPDLDDILDGDFFRICVEQMDSYTHADIAFDSYGRIHVEPITVGAFGQETEALQTPSPDAADAETAPPLPVVDVKVWYELIGQQVMDHVITELNAGGHSRLTIRENGDITIMKQKKETVMATLDCFPEKSYWEELVALFGEYQLNGKICGDHITLSWI